MTDSTLSDSVTVNARAASGPVHSQCFCDSENPSPSFLVNMSFSGDRMRRYLVPRDKRFPSTFEEKRLRMLKPF